MPPGGETSRYSGCFGENVLRHGSHEWLPYSKDEVLLECSNNNFSFSAAKGSAAVVYCAALYSREWEAPETGPPGVFCGNQNAVSSRLMPSICRSK